MTNAQTFADADIRPILPKFNFQLEYVKLRLGCNDGYGHGYASEQVSDNRSLELIVQTRTRTHIHRPPPDISSHDSISSATIGPAGP